MGLMAHFDTMRCWKVNYINTLVHIGGYRDCI
jgi:hypothetical protein